MKGISTVRIAFVLDRFTGVINTKDVQKRDSITRKGRN